MAKQRKPPVALDPDLQVPEREIPPVPKDADDREVMSIRDRAILERMEVERELTVLGAQVGAWRTELAQRQQREEAALAEVRAQLRRATEELTVAEGSLRARHAELVDHERREQDARVRFAGIQREIERVSAERLALGDAEAAVAHHKVTIAALAAEYDELHAGIATLMAEKERLAGDVALAEQRRREAGHEAERVLAAARAEAEHVSGERASQRSVSAALARSREELSAAAARQAEVDRDLTRRETAVRQAETDASATLARVREELEETKAAQKSAREMADRATGLLDEVAAGREALRAREAALDEREQAFAKAEQALGVRVLEQDERAERLKTKAIELDGRESSVRRRERALGKPE